jgi:hypothetical protein
MNLIWLLITELFPVFQGISPWSLRGGHCKGKKKQQTAQLLPIKSAYLTHVVSHSSTHHNMFVRYWKRFSLCFHPLEILLGQRPSVTENVVKADA